MPWQRTKSSGYLASRLVVIVLPVIHESYVTSPLMEEKISFQNCRGDTLSGTLHRPQEQSGRGTVILCHGMDSNKNSEKLVRLGRALAERGILALRFDFAYVGESSGKFEDIT